MCSVGDMFDISQVMQNCMILCAVSVVRNSKE